MKTLIYNELNPKTIPNFAKVRAYLEADDFRSAQVKKVGDNLYRAKLDRSDRLLFSIHRFGDQRYALLLEHVVQHAYDKSRFLKRGVPIDEDKVPDVESSAALEAPALTYVNPAVHTFHLLDKVISFDEVQHAVYRLRPPVIVIGSAGSGKTALTLEKMKEAVGKVLYVTRSPYLVHSSRSLYYAAGYDNENQEIDFFSFQEYLESIQVPAGRGEMPIREFAAWVGRQRLPRELRDPYQLYEEFKGVLTGAAVDHPYLSREEYLALGVRQSIFAAGERAAVYDLFTRYLAHMREHLWYDANILSWEYLPRVEPRYDFVVVDEVQDLTTIQLQLVLKSLANPHDFILCGDSNQIVHPNFFSWAKVKSLFHQQEGGAAPRELIRILNANYRNSPQVTELANRVLLLKNARFGSVDRESNYLVASRSPHAGKVLLLPESEELLRELDRKTRQSTRFAVIVMHPEQKGAAKVCFGTPLVFSIQEAKGLEYENVVLFDFISAEQERFREISRGVDHADLEGALTYARARDKGDKSLEIYKFHINALYVAVTRAVRNLYLVESAPEQALFDLLGLRAAEGTLDLEAQGSSLEEWRAEARRLELQGKQEQADEIRSRILNQQAVPWQVLVGDTLAAVEQRALEKGDKKARLDLFEYALVYHDQRRLNALEKGGFAPAAHPEKGYKTLHQKYFLPYEVRQATGVLRQADKYGVNFRNPFNETPLMVATRVGNAALVEKLVEMGADTELVNNTGFNALRIALEQACVDPKYAAHRLGAVYRLLEPDSITVQSSGRLAKLDNHLMEFLLLNLAMAMFYVRLPERVVRQHALASADFVEVLAHFPDSVLPPRRKQRQYISSILAKNEVRREDKYNRRLFYRVRHGHYIVSPRLAVRVGEAWCNVYDLLPLGLLDVRRVTGQGRYDGVYDSWHQDALRIFREQVQELAAGREE